MEWRAFYAMDPWGDYRADLRNALLGSLIAGGNGAKVTMQDLMLFDEEGRKRADEAKARERTLKMRDWFERKAQSGEKVRRR